MVSPQDGESTYGGYIKQSDNKKRSNLYVLTSKVEESRFSRNSQTAIYRFRKKKQTVHALSAFPSVMA